MRQIRAGRPVNRSLGVPAATCWDATLTTPVEIVAPDRESATLLLGLGEVGSHFYGELVDTTGPTVLVRLLPAEADSAGWVFELLALVERWLEAHRLPVAHAYHGGRNYLIRAPHLSHA